MSVNFSAMIFWFFLLQVANKLYPLSSISEEIEDFAKEMLLSVANIDLTTERSDTEGLNAGSQKVMIL